MGRPRYPVFGMFGLNMLLAFVCGLFSRGLQGANQNPDPR